MPAASLMRRAGPALLALLLAASSAAARAERTPDTFEPREFQEGKDVVWVPTPQVLVEKMLDMARVTASDFVMDLGSGDGRTVIAAAKRGARALGVEYDPDMVALSRRNAERAGVAGRAEFVRADLFETDLSQATVITMFLLPDINVRLRPKILELKPGTRVVSNTFDMGDWHPDDTGILTGTEGCGTTYCTALLWIVPARAEGRYQLPQGELTLMQEYQLLSGSLRTGSATLAVEGKVLGNDVILRAGVIEIRGRMNGKALELR